MPQLKADLEKFFKAQDVRIKECSPINGGEESKSKGLLSGLGDEERRELTKQSRRKSGTNRTPSLERLSNFSDAIPKVITRSNLQLPISISN